MVCYSCSRRSAIGYATHIFLPFYVGRKREHDRFFPAASKPFFLTRVYLEAWIPIASANGINIFCQNISIGRSLFIQHKPVSNACLHIHVAFYRVLIMYTRIHARIVFIYVVCISGEISANFTGKIVLINQRIDLFAFEDYLQEITTFEFMKMLEISSSAIRLLFVPRYITHIFKLPIF